MPLRWQSRTSLRTSRTDSRTSAGLKVQAEPIRLAHARIVCAFALFQLVDEAHSSQQPSRFLPWLKVTEFAPFTIITCDHTSGLSGVPLLMRGNTTLRVGFEPVPIWLYRILATCCLGFLLESFKSAIRRDSAAASFDPLVMTQRSPSSLLHPDRTAVGLTIQNRPAVSATRRTGRSTLG